MTQAIVETEGRLNLIAIIGQHMGAVTFVQDYVQLHFDGPMITAVTRPIVSKNGMQVAFGQVGYRDQLCALIAREVVRAYVIVEVRLQIDFDDETSIVIPLDPDAYRSAEAVIFTDGATGKAEQWAVW